VVYGMFDSVSSGSGKRCAFWDWIEKNKIEYFRAIVGFQKVEAQYFPTAHFGKPAHFRPVEEVIIPIGITVPCLEQ